MDIEKRLERLERANNRLKTLIYIGILGMMGVVTAGFAVQNQVREVVRAESFELVSRSGVVLGQWHLTGGRPELLQYLDIRAAMIGQLSDGFLTPPNVRLLGSTLIVTDTALDGTRVLTNVSPGLFVLNKGDSERLAVLKVLDRVGLEVQGSGGKATLGETWTVSSATGATTNYPASTLALFNANGNIRVQLPR